MTDPVICSDGHSYERNAISDWLRGHDRSPQTNASLPNKDLMPNHAMRNAIEEWNKRAAKDFKLVPYSSIILGKVAHVLLGYGRMAVRNHAPCCRLSGRQGGL